MTESILFNGLIALGLLAAVQMVLLLVVLRRSGSSNEPDKWMVESELFIAKRLIY